jgi:hypothetical protein
MPASDQDGVDKSVNGLVALLSSSRRLPVKAILMIQSTSPGVCLRGRRGFGGENQVHRDVGTSSPLKQAPRPAKGRDLVSEYRVQSTLTFRGRVSNE